MNLLQEELSKHLEKYQDEWTEEEIAKALDVSRPTIARDWRLARLMLVRILGPDRPQ